MILKGNYHEEKNFSAVIAIMTATTLLAGCLAKQIIKTICDKEKN